jgi:Uma2 family endonuclease
VAPPYLRVYEVLTEGSRKLNSFTDSAPCRIMKAGGILRMGAAASRTRVAPASTREGPRARCWTREEYHRASDLGLFRPDERLELLDGEIIEKMTQNSPHATSVAQAAGLLGAAFGVGFHTRSHSPIILNEISEPEPDVAVVPGAAFDYLTGHPRAADLLLIVEVSDATLRFDRTRKRTAYARAGIREYWILNLRERRLEVYRDPSSSRYRTAHVYGEPDTVTPLAAPHATLRVADLLPPAS